MLTKKVDDTTIEDSTFRIEEYLFKEENENKKSRIKHEKVHHQSNVCIKKKNLKRKGKGKAEEYK